ncbi:hypothetical protein HW555_013152 [Spodoptera exigua]|uniref:Serine hydrolase domain-containing protein n=1 Tax=Spodoptera exigua TaxID=7107 RepID=A0A835KX98_SPOEX|nr:hypothetical protein HW555_013152 [Spodoptera exigua]
MSESENSTSDPQLNHTPVASTTSNHSLAASASNSSAIPSASTSSDTPSASTSSETPSGSAVSQIPSGSTLSETPSTSTSSQIPSASGSSQAPSNLTLNESASTSNPSTSQCTEQKNKKIDPLKLKILCLHGYMQNAKKFKAKLGAFRKLVDKYAYLVFMSAPHVVGDSTGRGDEDTARSWWFNAEDNTYSGKCLGGPAIGFEQTLEAIRLAVVEHGPFDGLMGFSQGACLVGILASMQQKELLPFKFKFAMIISGFCSESLVHKGFYDQIINLPSLHVYGEGDSTIPKEMSESLINLFRSPVVVEHTDGHYVPTTGAVKAAYEDFLAEMYQQRLIDKQEAERTAE